MRGNGKFPITYYNQWKSCRWSNSKRRRQTDDQLYYWTPFWLWCRPKKRPRKSQLTFNKYYVPAEYTTINSMWFLLDRLLFPPQPTLTSSERLLFQLDLSCLVVRKRKIILATHLFSQSGRRPTTRLDCLLFHYRYSVRPSPRHEYVTNIVARHKQSPATRRKKRADIITLWRRGRRWR